MKDTKRNTFRIRGRLLAWAMRVPVEGRQDAAATARLVLVYLCGLVGIDAQADNYLRCWWPLSAMAHDTELQRMRLTRALDRLHAQGIIDREYAGEAWKGDIRIRLRSLQADQFASASVQGVAHLSDLSVQPDAQIVGGSVQGVAQNASGSVHISKGNKDVRKDGIKPLTKEQQAAGWQRVLDVLEANGARGSHMSRVLSGSRALKDPGRKSEIGVGTGGRSSEGRDVDDVDADGAEG